jgi:hypothetical protein
MTILGDLFGYDQRGLDITGSPKGGEMGFFSSKEEYPAVEPKEEEEKDTATIIIFMPNGPVTFSDIEDYEAYDNTLRIEFTINGLSKIYAGFPYTVQEKE